MNDEVRKEYVFKVKVLYADFRKSGLTMYQYIKKNSAEIDSHIKNSLANNNR